MMRLDRRRRPQHGYGFYDVGIKRSLREKFDRAELRRFFLKHLNKFITDALALDLGGLDASKIGEKRVGRIDITNTLAEAFGIKSAGARGRTAPRESLVDDSAAHPPVDGRADQHGG